MRVYLGMDAAHLQKIQTTSENSEARTPCGSTTSVPAQDLTETLREKLTSHVATGVSERATRIGPGGDAVADERQAVSRRSAFADVFRAQFEPLVRLATATVDQSSIAEDIVQDAFGQLWQRWDSVESPGAYVRTSVVHGCMQELRRRRVRRKHDQPDRPYGLTGEQHFMLDMLADLSIRRRTALVLRFYGGLSMQEIADAMGIRPGTAKSLISRGLEDLRKVVEK